MKISAVTVITAVQLQCGESPCYWAHTESPSLSVVVSPVVILGLQMRMATEFFRDAIFLFNVFFTVLAKGESLFLLSRWSWGRWVEMQVA